MFFANNFRASHTELAQDLPHDLSHQMHMTHEWK